MFDLVIPSNKDNLSTLSQNNEYKQNLQKLRNLPDNWDGAGAHGPNDYAYNNAEDIQQQSISKDIKITSIDPDVEGGIDIYIDIGSDEFWIHCTNNNSCILIQTDKMCRTTAGSWTKLGINNPVNEHK